MSDLIGKTLGKYQIVVRVGRGGMARVYKAYQASLDRYVALKVLHSHLAEEPDFIQRFEREATAVARLRHPSIVQVYDYDKQDELYFIVMEFVEGPTLKAELGERRKRVDGDGGGLFTIDEVSRIVSRLADAIDYAHSRGMIHRDLKPGNIMFTAEGEVLLTDFGLARMVYATHHTKTGTLSGTPAYMSPEQVQGTRVDSRSDTYSLGVIVYEMLTGRVPFEADTSYAIMSKHVTDPVPNPSEWNERINPELVAVLLKALDKDPEERFQTAGELSGALSTIFGGLVEEGPKGPLFVPIATSADSQEDMPISTYAGATPISQVLISSPYRGLYAFREEDAPYFFGRESFTDRLVQTVTSRQMAAVIGPSGSGKSSVVFAGLLPRIRDLGSWHILSIRPGSRPFYSLAEALVGELDENLGETDRLLEIKKMGEALRAGELNLDDIFGRLKKEDGNGSRQLLVVDQFEELYTLCTDDTVRRSYPNMLFQAIAASKEREDFQFTVVLTLRADFMGQALANRPFADALQDSDIKLGPMTRAELGRAIESPAGKKNVIFEAGLVDRILEDVGDEPGNLPLLEFALTLLWDRRTGRRLTHAAYEAIGRVEGSLARYADEIYEQLGLEDQLRARRIFTQMVRPGEGTEDTRRLATRSELGENDWLLAQKLADARLVITGLTPDGAETVEVVHEALIRGWSRLREWMNEERAFRTWQERLRVALRQWEDSQKDEGALLRGVPLGEAEGWMRRKELDLSQSEREFIQASVTFRERQVAEEEARRKKELDAARDLAEEQKLRAESEFQRAEEQLRSTRRLRLAAAILAVVFVIAVVAAILAVGQRQEALQQADARSTEVVVRTTAESSARNSASLAAMRADQALEAKETADAERSRADQEAEEAEVARDEAEVERDRADDQARLALARQLAAQSSTLLGPQLDLALLLSLEAYEINQSAETVGSILAGLQASPALMMYLRGHPGLLQSAVFNPGGDIVATVGADGVVLLWDTDKGEIIRQLEGHDPTQLVNRAAFNPAGDILATASDDLNIILWDVQSGEIIRRLQGHDNWVQALAFSPDGSRLISGGGDRSLHIWNVDTGQLLSILEGHSAPIWDVGYSVDGELIASAGADNVIMIFDSGSGELQRQLLGHTGPVFNIAFSPDGQHLASSSGDNSIIVWEVETGEMVGEPLLGHQAGVVGIAYSPDGQLIASGGADSTVRLWDVESQTQQSLWTDHNAMVNSVEFSHDGTLLASGDLNGIGIIWDVAAMGSLYEGQIEGLDGGVSNVVFDEDGDLLVSAGVDGFIRFWDSENQRQVQNALAHGIRQSTAVESLALSADGSYLASGSDNGTIMLWDVETGQQITQSISAATNDVTQLVFSADLEVIAAGSPAGFVSVWDIETGLQVGPFLAGHVAPVSAAAISPDTGYLATGAEDGTVIIRTADDITGGQGLGIPLTYTVSTTTSISALVFNPDSDVLASGDSSGIISLWDPQRGRVFSQTTAVDGVEITDLVFSEPGDRLAAGTRDGQVIFFDSRTLQLVDSITSSQDMAVTDLALSGQDSNLFILFGNGAAQTREFQTGELVTETLPIDSISGEVMAASADGRVIAYLNTDGTIEVSRGSSEQNPVKQLVHDAVFQGAVTNVTFSPDGSILASSGNDGAIVLWDMETREPLYPPLLGHSGVVVELSFSPDGSLLASGSCSQFHSSGNCLHGEAFIWEVETGNLLANKSDTLNTTLALAFSRDGSILALNDCDRIEVSAQCLEGAIQLWDYRGNALAGRLDGHTSFIWDLAFSPDGQILASSSNDNTIILWDMLSGLPIGQRLTNHAGSVRRLAFSPDGSMLASAGFDNLVFLWDVDSGQALDGPFTGHTANVMDVVFSPDGHLLASASLDGSIILWDVNVESWLSKACRIANRNLRVEEWERFLGDQDFEITCGD